MLAEKKLKTGVIYGDRVNNEYVYMPGSELGVEHPLCIYECGATREDVTMPEALKLITRRSLKPTAHPLLGSSTC